MEWFKICFLACAYLSYLATSSAIPSAPALSPRTAEPNAITNITAEDTAGDGLDLFWHEIEKAENRAKFLNPTSQIIYIKRSIVEGFFVTIDIVYTAYADQRTVLLFMRLPPLALLFTDPQVLPPSYPLPPGLKSYQWSSSVQMDLNRVTDILKRGGCYAREDSYYARTEIYGDEATGEVWYFFSSGVGMRYVTAKINARTGVLVQGDPVVPPGGSVQSS